MSQVTGVDDRMAEKRLAVVEYLQFREVVFCSVSTEFTSAVHQTPVLMKQVLAGVSYTSATYSKLLQCLLETVTCPVHGGVVDFKMCQCVLFCVISLLN